MGLTTKKHGATKKYGGGESVGRYFGSNVFGKGLTTKIHVATKKYGGGDLVARYFGSLLAVYFGVQIVTGVTLVIHFNLSVAEAYRQIRYRIS
jgi:quinol-cytochrome oxidoreductase complex cytochrome b subunit